MRLPLSAALVLAFSAQAAFAALPVLSVWPNVDRKSVRVGNEC